MVNFLSIPHFRKQKETGARMSGIITGDVQVSFWPIFFSLLINSPRSLCKSSLGPVSLSFLKWQIVDELFFLL